MADPAPIAALPLVGGHPALDFANTLGQHPGGAPHEHLTDYAALVVWSARVRLIGQTESRALKRRATAEPVAAQRVLLTARALRAAIYALATTQIRDSAPPEAELATLNRHLTQAQVRSTLVAPRGELGWGWAGESDALDRMLWPLAIAAAELLAESSPRLRQCAGEDCLWLFLDTSKNGARRWCSMADCGNRAKVRRFRRHKGFEKD